MMSLARLQNDDHSNAVELALEGINILNEPDLSLSWKSQTAIDQLIREYEEYDSIPPETSAKIDPMERSKLLCAFGMLGAFRNEMNFIKQRQNKIKKLLGKKEREVSASAKFTKAKESASGAEMFAQKQLRK